MDGSTPLHIAADKGYIEICALFIEKGANIETENKVRNNNHDNERDNNINIYQYDCDNHSY